MKHRQWQQRLLAVFLVVSLVLGSSVIEVRASQIEEETGDTVESEIDEAGQEQSIDENIEASETSEISDPETSVVEIQESEAIQDKVDHTEESEAETSEREDDNMSLIETETESVEEMAAEDAIILMDGEFVSLKNPRFELDSSMEAGRKITYDCVWFGSYPQREVVASASDSGVYGKSWAKADDYIVDATLYDELVKASYDTNGDTVVNGMKYRRITSRDATYWNNTSNGTDFYFNWSDAVTYRYFRFEPIKWRVLRVSGGKAFLLADQALDEQFYNLNDKNVTWKSSSIRSWLNGYGSTVNEPGKDYTTGSFIDSAFSSSEKKAIVTTDVVNEGNLFLKREGSKNTRDKLFLLSESEVYKTNTANSYGFISMEKYDDEARRSKSSTYAKAMGTCFFLHNTIRAHCSGIAP